MPSKTVVVIGAGIVGAATALWLQRAGRTVILIDKGRPGMGTSFGNAGILASSAIVPVTTPGLIPKAPRYLLDPNFPLFMRWSYLPRLVPWLIKYLGHANDADTRRIAKGLNTIIGDSLEQHQALARGTAAEPFIQPSDYVFAYKDRAAFDADKYIFDIRAEAGFHPEIIEGPSVQEREPLLSSAIGLLAAMPNHGFILNPAGYVQALVDTFTQAGGTFVQAEVKDFDLSGGQITGVETDQGRFDCERAVLSAGIWSRPLMDKLGIDVPMEAERGYHILFKSPNDTPNCPLMMSSAKFVATPMSLGLRCAGIVEFGGLTEKRSKAPFALLRRRVKEVFPTLTAASEEEWMGYRPAPSDSLPLAGEIGSTGVYTAFGHHHIGLTGGPKTARLVTDMIVGRTPNHDMSPYDPQRFKKRA